MTRLRSDSGASWFALVLAAAVVTLLVLASGCGGSWSSNARHSLAATAVMVDGVDHGIAAAIHDRCASASHDPIAVGACLHDHHLDVARRAIASSDAALRSAQAALDGAETAKDQHRWTAAAPCLAASVRDAFASIEAAGVTVPAMVDQALVFLGLAGQCNGATP